MITLMFDFERNVFYTISSFQEKDIIKGQGFYWNPQRYRWETDSIDKARSLSLLPDVTLDRSVEEGIKRIEELRHRYYNLSMKVNSNISVPIPEELKEKGYSYYQHQLAGIEYMLEKKNVLVADKMRLGKTIETIGYINITHPSRILIVAPNIAVYTTWYKELEKWLVNGYKISIVDGSPPVAEDNSILIMHYEQLLKYENELLMQRWDLIILDESHFIKNIKAKRTKVALKLRSRAQNRICLTGTPIINRVTELFPQLKFIGSDIASSWKDFADKYVVFNQFGWAVGSKNLDELNYRLRSTCMIRRTEEDVEDMPDRVRQLIVIPSDMISRDVMEENRKFSKYIQTYLEEGKDKLFQKLNIDGYTPSYFFQEISRIRHDTARSKVPFIVEAIKNTLEDEDKVVVFAYHHDVIEAIAREFPNSAVVYGEVPQKERDELINKFQTDPNCRVFIGSLRVASFSINLSVSSICIFGEIDWTPSGISQPEDRLAVMGKRNIVGSQFILVENTIDYMIASKIIQKDKLIYETLKGGEILAEVQ